jgi:hypothetical protein
MTDTTTEPSAPATPREAELEDRIRKLEATLAEKAATPDEEAVAERVLARLSAIAGEGRTPDGSDRVLVLASSAAPLVPGAPPPPNGAVLRPPAPPAAPSDKRWFLTQFWTEIRLIFRMYFDPHYRISRLTQFALPGIVLLLIFNYFFFSVWVSIVFVSPVAERLLAVVLGILGYKLMVREVARYREVLDYLARYGR